MKYQGSVIRLKDADIQSQIVKLIDERETQKQTKKDRKEQGGTEAIMKG